MVFMVFIIYIAVVLQFVNSKPIVKENSTRRGRNFFKISGSVNAVIGFVGMIAVNTFLRDKEIIPQFFVWCGLVGFFLTIMYAMYCFYKMMVSTES